LLAVSYCTRREGSRHRIIDQALTAKVQLFVSDYLLDELSEVLRADLKEAAGDTLYKTFAISNLRLNLSPGLPTGRRGFYFPQLRMVVDTASLPCSARPTAAGIYQHVFNQPNGRLIVFHKDGDFAPSTNSCKRGRTAGQA
jgi:hypothetical protein